MVQHSVPLLVWLGLAVKGRQTHGSIADGGDLRAILAELASGLLSSSSHT